jgi:hypothetical protein
VEPGAGRDESDGAGVRRPAGRGRVVRRLVAGQGPIQLVAALTAMAAHAAATHEPATTFDDYLAIFDLSAPADRERALAGALRALAEAVRPWRAVVHLSPSEVQALAVTQRCRGPRATLRRARTLIGLSRVDELYLIRNYQFANEVLINAYRDAEKICFGDGIGLHYGPGYLAGRPTRAPGDWRRQTRQALRALRARFVRATGLSRALPPVDFDRAYLALPGVLGGAAPAHTARLEPTALLHTLRAMAGALDSALVRALRERIGGRPTVFLVTSNFSEARRMDPGPELRAYRQFVEAQDLASGSVAVIKPHPREGTAKLAALRASLAPLFDDVLVLDEGMLAFAPFELLLLIGGFLHGDGRLRDDVRILTFSNSCLALALLFGIRPVLGFGERLVRGCFREGYVSTRLTWEIDMAAGLDRILRADGPAAG